MDTYNEFYNTYSFYGLNFNLSENSSVLYTLVSYKTPENDLKKIETCWRLSGLYVKVYILIPVHFLVLSFTKGITIIKGQQSRLLHLYHFMVVPRTLV
jgi:hypothetical protein